MASHGYICRFLINTSKTTQPLFGLANYLHAYFTRSACVIWKTRIKSALSIQSSPLLCQSLGHRVTVLIRQHLKPQPCEHDINEEEALRWASIQASTLNSSYSLNTTLVCAKMAVRHPMTPALSFYRLWCRQTSLLPHHSHMNANEYKFERAKSREHFNFGSGPGSYLFLARLIKLLSSLRWLRILCEIGLPFSSHHHLPRLLPFIRSTLQSPPPPF